MSALSKNQSSRADKPKRILVVDDEACNRQILSRFVERAGYQTISASNGQEALDIIADQPLDLVLLDISMPPGIDGLEVLKMVRRQHNAVRLPIIMVTAEDSREQVVRAFELGASDYVTKPIDPMVTRARIGTQIELREIQSALRESEERYALAAQGANDGLWDWNLVTGQIFYSPRWSEMLGVTEAELGSTPEAWFSRVHADDNLRIKSKLQNHLEGKTPHFESELRIRHSNGDYRWMLCRGQAVRNAAGVPQRIAGSLTDINDGKVADAVTGLPNRILFLDRVQRCIDQQKRHPDRMFAVMYLDLDNFKLVNDGLGHDAGDELLVAVAKRLETNVRSADSVIARIGGDEFAILLEQIDRPDDAFRVAERVLKGFESPFYLGLHEVFATFSMGISLSSSSSDSISTEDIVSKADTAMYQAKDHGKSCYRVFDPEMQKRVAERLRLETDLRRAVERNEFHLAYQPIVSIATRQVVGFETLIRWQHPELGLISPSEFIPVAEDTGVIVPIDHWVIRQSCTELKRWQLETGDFDDIYFSINVSRRQILHSDLDAEVREILEDTKVNPSQLLLEITESAVMHDADAGAAVLAKLQQRGIRIAVDDFGTGYSSLECLHRLPLDTLKIDQSFVENMSYGKNGAIVRTIVRLAESLDLSVIAEGIETDEQCDQLVDLGCTFGQGHLFARPMSAVDAMEFCRRTRLAFHHV